MTTDAGGEAAVVEDTAKDGERDFDAEAREQGWRPKEEWTGKPENWKDAKTYVEYGDTAGRLSKIEQRIEKEVSERVGRIEKVNATTIEKLKQIHNDEIASLKTQKTAAVKAGNVELVDKIDAEIDKRKDATPTTEEAKDVNAEFAKKHEWYGTDKELTALAVGISQDVLGAAETAGKVITMEEMFDEVAKQIEKTAAFKERNKKPSANGHADVDGGSNEPGAPKTTPMFSKLPPEAKAQCAKDVKAGLYKTNEDWAKVYFS